MNAKLLGDRVHMERRTLRMNQDELARRSGVSRTYISEIENYAVSNPTIDIIMSLASGLGVSAAYLLGLTDSPLDEEGSGIAERRLPYYANLVDIDDEEALDWLEQRNRSLAELMRAVKNLPDAQRRQILDHISRQLDLLVSLTSTEGRINAHSSGEGT